MMTFILKQGQYLAVIEPVEHTYFQDLCRWQVSDLAQPLNSGPVASGLAIGADTAWDEIVTAVSA